MNTLDKTETWVCRMCEQACQLTTKMGTPPFYCPISLTIKARWEKQAVEGMEEVILEAEGEKMKKCIYCKRKFREDVLYGVGVCEKCIKEGRPPFRG